MTTPAAQLAGDRSVHTRDTIIQALRDYAELYGDYFTTAAFNPSVAKWRDDPESRERYLAGNPKTGESWPSLNTIKAEFGGSFNAAREAAGLTANKPGPGKGKRPAGQHAPIRGVSDRVRVVERVKVVRERVPASVGRSDHSVGRSNVAPDATELRELRRELAAMERDRDRVAAALAKANDRLSAARERARTHATASAKQRERAERNASLVSELRTELRETAQALAAARARLEQVEATAVEQAAALTAARLDLEETREELTRAREQVDLADPEELRKAADEVRDARAKVAAAREAQAAARHEASVARAAQRTAETERDRALALAQDELRQRKAVQAAVAGHDRRLTPAELEELRGKGPAGYAVFAEAVKNVAKARASEPGRLRAALRDAAAAAVRWSDRL